MIHHILAPMDGSSLAESVLPHLVSVARPFNARITLLQVLEQSGGAEQDRPVDPLDWHIRKAEAETYLNGLAKHLQEQNLRVKSVLLEGQAAEKIIDFAHSQDFDLLLMSSHGRSGLSGWNVSSVVQKVILRVRTSVMIIRAYQPPAERVEGVSYERILVPLDGSQRAECALSFATGLAQFYQSQLLLGHVIQEPEMPRQMPPTDEDVELAERLVARNREEVSRYLDQLQLRLPVESQIHLQVSPSITASLHRLVEQSNVDMVILCAHGHAGETRWPYGSLAISFIAYGTTPLMVVQDLESDQIQSSQAELVAREYKGH